MRFEIGRIVATGTSALALVLATTAVLAATAQAAAPTECNEARRAEQEVAYLPECRAYELVTPPDATPYAAASLTEYMSGARASTAGGAIAWMGLYPPPGTQVAGEFFVSRRAAGGEWTTAAATPPQSTGDTHFLNCAPRVDFSPDLSLGVLADGLDSNGRSRPAEEYCQSAEPHLVEGEPEGAQNLFLESATGGSYRLVNVTPAGIVPERATFEGASTSFAHIFFAENAKLTAEAPEGEDLYEWTAGALRLVTVLPSGTPAPGTLANAVVPSGPGHSATTRAAASYTHAVSAAGTRVFFETTGERPEDDHLYMRVNPEQEQSKIDAEHEAAVNGEQCAELATGKACTIEIDASQAGGPGGGGHFVAASVDGTKVFFSADASSRLTSDTVAGSGQNLYEYEALTGKLIDLTPAEHAEVIGSAGVSDDGAYVYFVANGALAKGAVAGNCPTVEQQVASPETSCNLYVIHNGGAPTFIARLNDGRGEREDWNATLREHEEQDLASRMSPHGRYFAFNSTAELTGYDNEDAATGEPDMEIFLFDAETKQLTCVSCGAASERPTGPTRLTSPETMAIAGASLGYLQHNVLEGGSVVFNSPNQLAGATNGQTNVYEYAEGHVHLISSGTSTSGAYFYDASPSGQDVFFVTTKALLPRDTNNALSVYDARIDGGVAEPAAALPCSGEKCAGAAVPLPALAPPASVTFSGLGNLQPPAAQTKAPTPSTRKRKLAHALKVCSRRKSRHARRRCRRRARRRYGGKAAAARSHSRGHRRSDRGRRKHHVHSRGVDGRRAGRGRRAGGRS